MGTDLAARGASADRSPADPRRVRPRPKTGGRDLPRSRGRSPGTCPRCTSSDAGARRRRSPRRRSDRRHPSTARRGSASCRPDRGAEPAPPASADRTDGTAARSRARRVLWTHPRCRPERRAVSGGAAPAQPPPAPPGCVHRRTRHRGPRRSGADHDRSGIRTASRVHHEPGVAPDSRAPRHDDVHDLGTEPLQPVDLERRPAGEQRARARAQDGDPTTGSNVQSSPMQHHDPTHQAPTAGSDLVAHPPPAHPTVGQLRAGEDASLGARQRPQLGGQRRGSRRSQHLRGIARRRRRHADDPQRPRCPQRTGRCYPVRPPFLPVRQAERAP